MADVVVISCMYYPFKSIYVRVFSKKWSYEEVEEKWDKLVSEWYSLVTLCQKV